MSVPRGGLSTFAIYQSAAVVATFQMVVLYCAAAHHTRQTAAWSLIACTSPDKNVSSQPVAAERRSIASGARPPWQRFRSSIRTSICTT